MNLLPYLHDLTISIVGEQRCAFCGNEDYFFALEGECAECKKLLAKHNNQNSLLYSESVLREFIFRYDELMPELHKKVILVELLKDITYMKVNKTLPTNDRIQKQQGFWANTGTVGSKKYGAVFVIKATKSELGFEWQFPNPMERIKSITAVLSSLRFIFALPVNNDFLL